MKRKSKKLVLPLSRSLSKKSLAVRAAGILILASFLIYRNPNADNEISKSSQPPHASAIVSSPTLNPTPITRPAEECAVTSASEAWDTYTCTHFTFQLPKGWHGDYGKGYDYTHQKSLSSSEFLNYDPKATPYSTDQKLQKIYIGLFLSRKNLKEYVNDYENITRKDLYLTQATFSSSPITMNGYDGLKVHTTGARSAQDTFYLIQNPSKTVILHFGGSFGVSDSLLDEIFSTIKFTDSGN